MCISCQESKKLADQKQAAIIKNVQDCPFNPEKLEAWQSLLLCVKENDLYEAVGTNVNAVNAALGIVLSALRYNKIPCYFEKQLTSIEPTIFLIINSQQCP